jgi:hypothetical protein
MEKLNCNPSHYIQQNNVQLQKRLQNNVLLKTISTHTNKKGHYKMHCFVGRTVEHYRTLGLVNSHI